MTLFSILYLREFDIVFPNTNLLSFPMVKITSATESTEEDFLIKLLNSASPVANNKIAF